MYITTFIYPLQDNSDFVYIDLNISLIKNIANVRINSYRKRYVKHNYSFQTIIESDYKR